jgi:hypothetical protein
MSSPPSGKEGLLKITGPVLLGILGLLIIAIMASAGCLTPSNPQNLSQQSPEPLSPLDPSHGVAGALVPVSITGTNFSYGVSPSVWLAKPGESDILAVDTVVISPTLLKCTFPLPAASASAGQWDVFIMNADGSSAIKAGVFTVQDERAPPFEWNWSRDTGWEGWQHGYSCSVTGTKAGSCLEYGPVIVNGHGEYGTNVTYDRVPTMSYVSKTFTAPNGSRWSTVTFKGALSSTSLPRMRWLTIDVNGVNVLYANATQTPPGSGQPFTIVRSFAPSDIVTIRISDGQDLTVRPVSLYSLQFDSLTLS